jgi:hypothetical protein
VDWCKWLKAESSKKKWTGRMVEWIAESSMLKAQSISHPELVSGSV